VARIAKAAEIVAASPGEHFLLWHDLEAERREIEKADTRRGIGLWRPTSQQPGSA